MGKPAARLLDMTMHGGVITGPGAPTVLIGNMPAARMTDLHTCPMCNGPVPHVGGIGMGPVPPTVFISKIPAACVGDMMICVGPPSSILPPGCPTVLLGQSGAGGGGGGGGSGPKNAATAKALKAGDIKPVEGTEAFPINLQLALLDLSQHFTREALMEKVEEIAQILQEAASEAVEEVAEEEGEEDVPFTIADIVSIIKEIESEEGYEAARFFASYLDYSTLTEMASAYVSGEDTDSNNDPNLMPTRFMLLFGADDAKLKEIDDHPDRFEGEEHKITVANLRKALRVLGYDIAEEGPYDEEVYRAHMQYTNSKMKGDVKSDEVHIVEEGEDLGSIADTYLIPSWKYLYKINHEKIGDNPDLLKAGTELTIPQWNATTGDEKIEAKGVSAFEYTNGLRYFYPWVPFSLSLVNKNENLLNDFSEEKECVLWSRSTEKILARLTIKNASDISVIAIDCKDIVVGIKGFPVIIKSRLNMHPDDIVHEETEETLVEVEEIEESEL